MNYFDPRYETSLRASWQGLLDKVTSFLPNLLAAIVFLIVGWIIGIFLSKLVQKILELVHIDELANRLGLDTLSVRVGRKLSISRFGGWLVKWFFFLFSIIAAANVLGLTQVSEFFYTQVLPYAGHVIVATVVLFLGILAADFFSGVISSTVKASGFGNSSTLSAITKWAIVSFAVIAALYELQIAPEIVQDLFRAIIAMLAIAGGLAFGLGGRDHAKKVLDAAESSLTRKV